MTPAAVAVAGGPCSTAIELSRAGHDATLVHLGDLAAADLDACRLAGVHVLEAPELDVRVTARWLQDGYRLYRAITGRSFDAVVFNGNVADAYCAGRARETASALEATALVVRREAPSIQRLAEQPFVAHHELGAAVTEELAVGLADEVVHGSSVVDALARDTSSWRTPPAVDDPLVSVVVPLYERTAFLFQCLESLARQRYRSLEVLVPKRPSGIGHRALVVGSA